MKCSLKMSDHENESYSEEEEITDLSNPAVVLKYKTAADIVNKALQGVLSQCVAGKLVSDICTFGDLLIESVPRFSRTRILRRESLSLPAFRLMTLFATILLLLATRRHWRLVMW